MRAEVLRVFPFAFVTTIVRGFTLESERSVARFTVSLRGAGDAPAGVVLSAHPSGLDIDGFATIYGTTTCNMAISH